MKGRVAILKGYGEGYDLEEHPVPEPEPGAMVAKVALAGICGSDLHAWRGDLSETSSPTFSSPQAPGLAQGHEMTGSVYRLGKGLTTDAMGQPLREGDRICYSIHFPCFHCPICVRGSFNMCPNRRGALPAGEWPHFTGTFADYFYLPPNHFAFKAPPELSDEVLAPVNCAMAAVLQGLSSVGVTEGDSVVIQGAGALGISATAFAKDLGAHPIIVLDMLEHRLAMAAAFGADHTVKVDASPPTRTGSSMSGGWPAAWERTLSSSSSARRNSSRKGWRCCAAAARSWRSATWCGDAPSPSTPRPFFRGNGSSAPPAPTPR